jgi:hypothetical protein
LIFFFFISIFLLIKVREKKDNNKIMKFHMGARKKRDGEEINAKKRERKIL